MKDTICVSNEYLANLCLENAEEYHGYNAKDLENATIIFSHFLMDIMYQQSQHLSQEKQLELADWTGEAIRELIEASTGFDMHEVVQVP